MQLFGLVQRLLWFSGLGMVFLPAAVEAEIRLTRAQIHGISNQVEMLAPSGNVRPVARGEYFLTGDVLSTQASAQAELLFNDGSLARLGQLSQLSFWPQTRQVRLTQGTVLLLVPPTQGRLFVHTPNAITGIQNNAAVVRHVAATGLTLVLALASAEPGAVSITTGSQPHQEVSLAAGQMAFVQGSEVEVVEFDLLEFYETSRLVAGLNPTTTGFPIDAPFARLRPGLLKAMQQQSPFSGSSPVLNPATIRVEPEPAGLFGEPEPEAHTLEGFVAEEIRRYDDAPPGVITPLPDLSPSELVEETPLEAPATAAEPVETLPETSVEP